MANGICGILPEIKKAKLIGTKLFVSFMDGRELLVPKKYFPFIKKDTGKIFISGGNVIIFDKLDEVIHIEELLGRHEDYRYTG